MIIDSLAPAGKWPDAATLAQCSLTQRDWHSAAMKSLYSRIQISGKKQYALLENTLRNNESLVTKVQALNVLDITPDERISTTILHTPQIFRGIEDLCVLFGAPEKENQKITFPFHYSFLATLRQFRSMQNAFFYHIELESLDEIRKILGSLPNLKSTIFRNVTWKKPCPNFKPLFNATSRQLSQFSLVGCTSNFVAPFFWAAPPPSRQRLHSHDLPMIIQSDVGVMTELAKLIMSSIELTTESIYWKWIQDNRKPSECKMLFLDC